MELSDKRRFEDIKSNIISLNENLSLLSNNSILRLKINRKIKDSIEITDLESIEVEGLTVQETYT